MTHTGNVVWHYVSIDGHTMAATPSDPAMEPDREIAIKGTTYFYTHTEQIPDLVPKPKVATICGDCGVLVLDEDKHIDFHNRMRAQAFDWRNLDRS